MKNDLFLQGVARRVLSKASVLIQRVPRMALFFGQRLLVVVLLSMSIFGTFDGLLKPFNLKRAEAAQVSIDTSAQTAGISHLHAGPQTVFISDQVGYKFYIDAAGTGVYSKTSDGGNIWDPAVTVDNQTDVISMAVWYDQWTPNATGTTIHIATIDTSSNNDNIFYNALDTNGDTRLNGAAGVNTDTGNVQTYTLVGGANYVSITKATNGTVYVAVNDSSDSAVLRCSTTCGTSSNWTEVGTNPFTNANDYSLLVPLVNNDIMVINRVIVADDLRSKKWNNATNAWDAAWVVFDINATDNATYDVGMAATIASSTVAATTTIFLAYTADNVALGSDSIRTARYQNGVWSTSTAAANVLDNDARGVTNVAISRDRNTGNIYVAYTARTTPGTVGTGNVYWKVSTTTMASWSAETGPINSAANDMYGVDLTISSSDRIYATWFGVTGATIFGDTIADLVPGIIVSTTSAQFAQVTASTSNFHVGGTFAMTEYVGTRNVTAVTIAENGTVNAQTALNNIRLYYENDISFPYDCASESYGGIGGETQFGSTDTNGFSGADGVSAFSGSSVAISTTSALCFYVILDVLDSALNNDTINIVMSNPSTDIVVTGGGEIQPTTLLDITGSTTIKNDWMTQTHYHFRNDNGSETTATSRTGGIEDTALSAIKQSVPLRMRMEVSNAGGTTSPAMQYRLEYSVATTTCSAAYLWTDVGASADDWDMYNSTNTTDGANTTNIAVATGGVTDSNTSFLVSNGGVKDTSSQTGALTATSTQFIELEYSVIASTTATEGNTYCFRLTDSGSPLPAYTVYPRATISADVNVTATSTQIAQSDIPSTNTYIGGAYVITEAASARNVTSITLTEDGSVDAALGIQNVKLFYDLDTSLPYDCASESFSGSEARFGATSTAFSSANGTSTFTGSVAISTTSTMCVYTVLDVTNLATNNQTLNVIINQPSADVLVSGGGSVAPNSVRDITGSTALRGAVLTQSHYHWRNDDGIETGATSATGGVEDTALSTLDVATPIRLRLQVSNEGAISSPSIRYRLEFAPKISTCSAVAAEGWTDVEAVGGAWDMYNSANLTDGNNTTDIAVGIGGVTNPGGKTFLTPNTGVKDTSSFVASTTLSATQFIEMEFSVKQTASAGYSVPYCFRASQTGSALNAYTVYPELTTAPKRDFKIQRKTSTLSGTSLTLLAGTDYIAPSASTSAFMRITNSAFTGAGPSAGGSNTNADDTTAYIQDASNIMSSVTLARTGSAGDTVVSWEIVEFIGTPGSDNEIKVRAQQAVAYGSTASFATGTAASGVVDDTDVVVFITGQMNPDGGRGAYNAGLSISSWNAATDEPVFERGDTGSAASAVSYAVVEFTGANWQIQRVSHTYTAAGTPETESISSVNSLSRTFLHAQKLSGSGLTGTDEFGHEVWLSSVGAVSFQLESGASSPNLQRSVAWVVENLQTTTGEAVVTRSSGSPPAGTAPQTVSTAIGATLVDKANASIFITSRSDGTLTAYPRSMLGATIASTTHYELFRSNTGATVNYRTEVVEWPVAGLAFRQNDYRLYVDNNALKPTDPWPVGASNLGENTSISANDLPPGDSEVVRIRMSVVVSNSTLPQATQAFTLQFGLRVTTCSAISAGNWFDLGNAASSTVWRGFAAPGTTDGAALSGDPPTGGDLLLAVSDIAGTLEEENASAANPFAVADGQDVEYDWLVQHNGALEQSTYCFRMIKSDGATFDGYLDYPQIRTAGFTPTTRNWRWYGDYANETPSVALAAENVTPIDFPNGSTTKLRVTVKETKSAAQDDARFRLQYSEYSDFTFYTDVATSSGCTATSTWCYADGGGSDNGVITTKNLSDVDACAASVGNGCGTHNESPSLLTGFRHTAAAATEYEFTLLSAAPRVNRTYFFRLFDMQNGLPVPTYSGSSYPSLMTEGAHLVFNTTSLATSTVTEGVTTDVASTPTGIAYGDLPPNTQVNAAQRLSVSTNATEGYKILMYSSSHLVSAGGSVIAPIAASNTAPIDWATACAGTVTGCYGYHAGDDTLEGGSVRFAPNDTFAAFDSTPQEVAYSSTPVTNDTVDIVFRLLVRDLQETGQYQAGVGFITIPIF